MPLAFTTGTSSHSKNTLQRRKFEIKVLLLLHVLIPGVMLSSLETINPWLSACDLKQQQSPSDLKQGSCTATQFPTRTTPQPDVELLCPKECPPNESKTNASCLAYLDDARRNAICNFNLGNGIEWLKSFLGTIRLRHCCEYKIIESLSQSLLERVLRGKEECFRIIDSLVDVDNLAARVTCEFSEILSRYDCQQPYSVKFSCNDCLEAYRRWVCSTLVPYFNESTRIRPCRSVCQSVEQKCPYFLPENKAPALPTQYAGEPTFLCMDPNIPEAGEQQRRSLYPDQNACCVKICGSLKDGLCVEKGSNCKSEELIAYEEALDQVTECGAGDPTTARVPSLECTASEPYSSPHKLGSGGSAVATSGGPALALSAYLAHRHTSQVRRIRYLFAFLVFIYLNAVPSTLKMLACLIVAFTDVSFVMTTRPPKPLLKMFYYKFILILTGRGVKARLKSVVFHLIKRCKLIFNYLKFNSNKWQYYFILISVNLLLKWIRRFDEKHPEPLTTPPPTPPMPPFCFLLYLMLLWNDVNGLGDKKTRRARRYYYYYYNNNNYPYHYDYYDYYYYYCDCFFHDDDNCNNYNYHRYRCCCYYYYYNYYYYYYYNHRHHHPHEYSYNDYYVIVLLRRIAQNSMNEFVPMGSSKSRGSMPSAIFIMYDRRKCRDQIQNPISLNTIIMNMIGNDVSLTMTRITIYSDVLTIIITPLPPLLPLLIPLLILILLIILLILIELPLLLLLIIYTVLILPTTGEFDEGERIRRVTVSCPNAVRVGGADGVPIGTLAICGGPPRRETRHRRFPGCAGNEEPNFGNSHSDPAPVKVCCFRCCCCSCCCLPRLKCSDPKCAFQTFLESS